MTMIPEEITTSSYLKLRILKPKDAPQLFQLTDTNREHLGIWLPWVEYVNAEADSLNFIELGLAGLNNGKSFHYGVWYADRLAGVIGAHTWKPGQKFLEIGYWLGKDFEGKGVMSQACTVLIDRLFASNTVRTVQICCDPANQRSAAIPKKLGFELTERVNKLEEGVEIVLDVYQVTRETWKG